MIRAAIGPTVRRALLRTLLVLATILALLWLLAVTGVGMGLLLPWALARGVPEGWTVDVGSVEGAWGSRIHAHDVSLQGPAQSIVLDELLLEYRLLPLLQRTLDVRRAHVVRPVIQGSLSVADGSAPERGDPDGGENALDRLLSGSPLGDWTLRLGELRVEDAEGVLTGTAGTYRIERADLAAAAAMSPSGTSLRLDSLAVDVIPPPADSTNAPSGKARIQMAAELHGGVLSVSSLRMHSPRSRVTGAGDLGLAALPGRVDDLDFELDADPLDLRDLPIELPASIAADPLLVLHVRASGPPEAVTLALDLAGPGSTSMRAHGLLRASPGGPAHGDSASSSPALELDARLALDLADWTASPYAGKVAADLEIGLAALESTTPLSVRGTVVHSPPDDAPADILGDPLRVAVDVARAYAVTSDSAGASVLAVDGTATLYRPPGPLGSGVSASEAEWREVGTVAAQAEGHRSRWQLDLLLDSGSLEATGAVSWAEGARELVVDDLRARQLDLSSLAARLPMSAINARLDGRVAGASISQLVGRVGLALDSSWIDETRIDSLSLDAVLAAGSVTGAATATWDQGRLATEYEVALGDSLVEATLTHLAGAAPIDSLLSPLPPWSVNGRGSGTWSRGATRRGTLTLALDSSSVGGLQIATAAVEGEMLGDSVTATVRADIGAILSAPGALTGSAAGRGTSLSDAVGTLDLRLVRLHVAESDSTALTGFADSVLVQVAASEPGQLTLEGRVLPGEGGLVNLKGSATALDGEMSFDLTAVGALATPAQLLRGGTIERVALETSGVRTSAGWTRFTTELLLTDGSWQGVVADTLRTNFYYDTLGFALDTLMIDSNVLALAGSGVLPTFDAGPDSIDFTAHFDLEPMRGYTERELPTIGGNELRGSISGTTDSIDVALASSMTALVHREVRISGFEAALRGIFRPPFNDLLGLTSGNARIELDRIGLPDSDVGNLTVQLDGTPDSVRMEVSALVDDTRSGEMEARIDPTPDGRKMDLDRLELQLDEDRWELIQPAVLSFYDGVALRGLELRAGEQAISIDGGLTADGALDLYAYVDSTDLGTVADLLGYPRLDGWLGGVANLWGTRDAPVGTVDLAAGFHEEGGEPTTVRLLLDSDGLHVDTQAELRDPDDGVITVTGIVPLQGEEVIMNVDASSFAIDAGAVFIDAAQITELEGTIDADIDVTGTVDYMQFEGPISLSDGLARSPLVGVTWEEIRVAARGEGRSLVIDSATVETGSGSMRVAGSVSVEDSVALDLDAAFDEFRAIQTNAYQASISGRLHAGGTPLSPVVEGRVTTESLDVYIDQRPGDGGLEDVALTPADFEILRERFGYVVVEEDLRPRTSELITATVSIEFGRDSWIRSRSSPEMAIAFAGEVELRLEPGEEPHIQGEVTTIPERGYIAQFGKRFSPREGTVTVNGLPVDAELDLSATYTIPSHANPDGAEATIILGVTGTQDSLSLTLSSEPPMENADIVSYIATGRPAASTFALGDAEADAETPETDPPGGGLAETGAGIAVGQILSSIETAAQTGVGLDVVEIRREGIRGATLAAGKYVSPRLYVGFAQPILRRERDGLSLVDQNGSEIEIEFLAIKGLLLNLEGSASALSFFLRGRVAY
jgi:translocation and assembly module TamB